MQEVSEQSVQHTTHYGGMGAICYPEGVLYRVWAPNAFEVFVMGTFNDWQQPGLPLTPEENGKWAALVPQSKEGDEYKFVLKTPNGEFMRNDPYALKVTHSSGNSVVYNHHSFDWEYTDFNMPSWQQLVIYEMHVGIFNVVHQDQVGTFYTAIEKIPYLVELGVNVVEVMPCTEFPGSRSWGYNPSNPFAVESDYGGPDGLKAFIKAAHQAGIAVILDVVYNHFGPSDLDMWQFDGWNENGGGGIYFYNDWKANTPWGATRPDYGRPEVRQYIYDNAIMWLEDYRADGLRMDMVPYIRNVNADDNEGNDLMEGMTLLQWINHDIRQRYPNRITIAEDMHSLSFITKSVEEGGLGYGSQWDSTFVHTIRDAIISGDDGTRDMEKVVGAILHNYNGDAFQRIIYTESHDEVANGKARIAEEIADGDVNNWYSKKRAILGVALVMTSPGIPMLFQGQALLEDKWFSDSDPLDWSRQDAFKGFFNAHRDLVHLRRNWFGVTGGLQGQHTQILRCDQAQNVLAFHRYEHGGPKDSVVVVMNLSAGSYYDYNIGLPAPGTWHLRLNSDDAQYDDSFRGEGIMDINTQDGEMDGCAVYGSFMIPAYSVLIYSQE